jgi:hypothetical protein
MRTRIIISLLLALCVVASAEAQIIGGGVLSGGGGNLPAKFQPALWLDASDGYCWQDAAAGFVAADKSWLQIADASQTGLDPGTDDCIISVYVYFTSLSNSQCLFSKGANAATGSSSAGYALVANANGSLTLYYGDGTGSRLSATSTAGVIITNTWCHVALAFDRSGSANVYKDGNTTPVLTLDISPQAGEINSSQPFMAGVFPGNLWHFDGRLDSLMFFKAADLSGVASDIIAWAYNAGAGRLGEDITTAQKTAWGAVSCWDLNGSPWVDSWGSNDLAFVAAELVTNGTFTGNSTGWTEGAGWAYGSNNEAGTAAEADLAQSTVVPTVGKLYTTSFITAITGGTIRLNLGGVNGTTRSTSATHAENMRATSTASLVIDPVTAYTGTIDTVSVMAAELLPVAGIVRGKSTDEGDVSYWMDRSGNGRHAEVLVYAQYPEYETTGPNGRATVVFDGVDDRLPTTLQGWTAATVFVVFKGGLAGDGIFGINDSNIQIAAGPVIAGQVASHDSSVVVSDEDPTSQYQVACLTYGGNGEAEALYVDGVEEYSGTQSGSVAADTDNYTLGAIESGGTVGTFGACEIAAIIAYDEVLTEAQRNLVTTWIKSVYGL